MPSVVDYIHRIIAFKVKGRHVKRAFGCAVFRCRMNVFHVTVKPQVVYRAVYVHWKLQNNREKRERGHRRQIRELKNQKKLTKNMLLGPLGCISSI